MVQVEHEPRQLLIGAALMIGTAIVQTFGILLLQELGYRVRERFEKRMTRLRMLSVLSSVIIFLFALHVAEMCLWAALYFSVAPYGSFAVALYESAIAFTTLDVAAALPLGWKFLSAAEAVTGLLMFAWSTGVLFHQTSWVTEARHKYLREHSLFGGPPIPPG